MNTPLPRLSDLTVDPALKEFFRRGESDSGPAFVEVDDLPTLDDDAAAKIELVDV